MNAKWNYANQQVYPQGLLLLLDIYFDLPLCLGFDCGTQALEQKINYKLNFGYTKSINAVVVNYFLFGGVLKV